MSLLRLIQRFARAVFGEYQVFAIMACECPVESTPADHDGRLATVSTPERPSGSDYAGDGSYGFAWTEDGQRLCACWVWFGDRYHRDRNFWPLAADEGKLISLETAPAARGRGLAPQVLAHARAEMGRHGIRRLYARVWHSNAASLRAFAKDGWSRHATVIELYPLGRRLRLVRRHRPSPRADLGGPRRQPGFS